MEQYLDKMSGKTVLVMGDLMLDRFVYGDVDRISPESPVPVLSVRREENMLGGAGNVLSNLAALGVSCDLLAVVGVDDAAANVQDLVSARGADPEGLIADPDRPTTIKTRFLAAHQQLLRSDFEQAGPVTAAVADRLLTAFAERLPGAQAVILSDYGKGVLTPSLLSAIIAQARTRGVPVLVDPKGTDYSRYRGVQLVTPNRKELALASGGMPLETDAEIVAAARHVIAGAGVEAVLVTRSQDGMSVVRGDETPPLHLATRALEVFDVSGAGDTVIATAGAALAAGATLEEAAILANLAGGIVVAKVGTTPVRREELENALAEYRSPGGGRRSAALSEAAAAREQVQKWQARGLRVGFTNGCFDILHAGHTGYLARARERCDRLVVGLNADESVRRLKGPERPVNGEDSRARVLAALSAVDMVVLFGQDPVEKDTPCRIIEALRPDMFFKGGDYREDDLPEAAIVRAYGGTVAIMPLYEGYGTTALIDRVKQSAG